MRAVVLEEKGGPEVLRVREIPDPVPGPEEVLVRVASSALNRADLLQRLGFYPGRPTTDEVPGLELAGTVTALGERVEQLTLGAPVMGIVGGGAHAELAVVHERQLLAVPPTLSLAEAGAVPEVFMTAWDALVLQGGLTSGRVALVHAGASGVGTAAIQLVKALGATVVVTASGPKCAACRALGADLAVDYRTEDWVAACKDLTAGHGVDVVLDVIGGDYLARNLQALRIGGTIVQVGVMGGGKSTFDLGTMLPKRATLVGTVLRGRPIEEKIAVTRQFAREVLPLLGAGRLRPIIDRRYGLDDIADAHRYMESNANVGKIAIDIGGFET